MVQQGMNVEKHCASGIFLGWLLHWKFLLGIIGWMTLEDDPTCNAAKNPEVIEELHQMV